MKNIAERLVLWYIRRKVGYHTGLGRRVLEVVAAAWIERFTEDNLPTLICYGREEIDRAIMNAYEQSIRNTE
jgi:hypothetical protein